VLGAVPAVVVFFTVSYGLIWGADRFVNPAEGGVLLHLRREGRGIGAYGAGSSSWGPGAVRPSTSHRCFTPTRPTTSRRRATTSRTRRPGCLRARCLRHCLRWGSAGTRPDQRASGAAERAGGLVNGRVQFPPQGATRHCRGGRHRLRPGSDGSAARRGSALGSVGPFSRPRPAERREDL